MLMMEPTWELELGSAHAIAQCAKHGETMTLDESEQIEELLSAWYDWQRSYFPPLGAPRVVPSCRNFVEGNRHLDIEERAEFTDLKLAAKQSEQVDLCVDALDWQHRAAIHAHMKRKVTSRSLDNRAAFRNAECGVSVWRNPRKFDFSGSQHVAYQEAKSALRPLLNRRGLLKNMQSA